MTGGLAGSLTGGLLADGWTDPTSVGYPAVFLGVLIGSIVPVIPTGAVVGAGAAFAMTSDGLALPVVLVFAVAGAVLGDLVTFAVCRFGGPRALRRIARRQDPERVEGVRDQFRRHGWQIVVIGRLLPAGRIPVLLAAGALDYPWRRMVPAVVVAASLWAVAYAALGVLSGGIFDSPLVATLLATLLVLLVGGVLNVVGARRRSGAGPPAASGRPHPTGPRDPAGPCATSRTPAGEGP